MPAPKPLPAVGAAAVIAPTPGVPQPEPVLTERPDGWYWTSPDGRRQFGPFASASDARADAQAWDEAAPEPGETLAEAEAEIGIADWIDPQTGEPAEGQSPPHLPDE